MLGGMIGLIVYLRPCICRRAYLVLSKGDATDAFRQDSVEGVGEPFFCIRLSRLGLGLQSFAVWGAQFAGIILVVSGNPRGC